MITSVCVCLWCDASGVCGVIMSIINNQDYLLGTTPPAVTTHPIVTKVALSQLVVKTNLQIVTALQLCPCQVFIAWPLAWPATSVRRSYAHTSQGLVKGGLHHLLPKFEHIFVAAITFPLLSSVQILLIPACCVCFQMICEMSL